MGVQLGVVMDLSESQLRDFIFDNYRENFSTLIVGRRNPKKWTGQDFPPLRALLQHQVETRINDVIDRLETLSIQARELRLERQASSTTRIDLFGTSPDTGVTIIELKKSSQTERQAFTELLAYSNHFCSLFAGLTETSVTGVLVAPMAGRTVRDAYAQELITNNKNMLALVPALDGQRLCLHVYYPDDAYYSWYEDSLLHDRSMCVISISFPLLSGWIDSDLNAEDEKVPDYTVSALNTISSSIAHKLEERGYHGLVYASQKWGQIASLLPYPNTIYVVAQNPFSNYRTSVHEGIVYGDGNESRLQDLQAIHDQFDDKGREDWLDSIRSCFQGEIIRLAREEFFACFRNKAQSLIDTEIGVPDWEGLKCSVIDAVTTHNLNIYPTGLLRRVYASYVEYMYRPEVEYAIYYSDDFPKWSYKSLREFLPVWEILRTLGLGRSDEDVECDAGKDADYAGNED